MKRKKTTPKVNLPGHSIILHLPGQADHFLEQRWKKEGGRSWQLLTFEIQKVGPQTAGLTTSCRTDVSSTLAQNCYPRILSWNASSVQKHFHDAWQEWIGEETRQSIKKLPPP